MDYRIGTTLIGMTLLNALPTPLPTPQANYRAGGERVKLASGLVRDHGFPTAEWRFPILSLAQRDQLRGFCAGTSADIYIRTSTDASGLAHKTYRAVMVWPDEEDIQAELAIELTLRFEAMIEQV